MFQGNAKVGEVYICFMHSLLSMSTYLRYVTSAFSYNFAFVFSYVLYEAWEVLKTYYLMWPIIGKKLPAIHQK